MKRQNEIGMSWGIRGGRMLMVVLAWMVAVGPVCGKSKPSLTYKTRPATPQQTRPVTPQQSRPYSAPSQPYAPSPPPQQYGPQPYTQHYVAPPEGYYQAPGYYTPPPQPPPQNDHQPNPNAGWAPPPPPPPQQTVTISHKWIRVADMVSGGEAKEVLFGQSANECVIDIVQGSVGFNTIVLRRGAKKQSITIGAVYKQGSKLPIPIDRDVTGIRISDTAGGRYRVHIR